MLKAWNGCLMGSFLPFVDFLGPDLIECPTSVLKKTKGTQMIFSVIVHMTRSFEIENLKIVPGFIVVMTSQTSIVYTLEIGISYSHISWKNNYLSVAL